jgi:hypothetical protein
VRSSPTLKSGSLLARGSQRALVFLLTGNGYIFAPLEQIVTVSSSENEKPHGWERPTIALL